MSIGSILNSDYSLRIQKTTKQYTSKVENVDQTKELSDAEKLENFKKDIWNEINSMPWNKSVNVSVQITDEAFQRMMNEPDFKERMLTTIGKEAAAAHYPITTSLTVIDENGYSGQSWNYGYGEEVYTEHSTNKDNFYSRSAQNKDGYLELWEQAALKRKQIREQRNEEYIDSLYSKRIFKHKEDIAKLYEEKTIEN